MLDEYRVQIGTRYSPVDLHILQRLARRNLLGHEVSLQRREVRAAPYLLELRLGAGHAFLIVSPALAIQCRKFSSITNLASCSSSAVPMYAVPCGCSNMSCQRQRA